jgi:hypothetical protein
MKRFVMLSIILSALLVSCIPGKSSSKSNIGVSLAGAAGTYEIATAGAAGVVGTAGAAGAVSSAGVAGK